MNTAEVEAAMGIKRVLLELQGYTLRRPIDDEMGKSIDALVAAGALSPESAAFIRDRGVQFYGFNTNRIGHAIPVLEMVLANSNPPCRMVGFSNGSVGTLRPGQQTTKITLSN